MRFLFVFYSAAVFSNLFFFSLHAHPPAGKACVQRLKETTLASQNQKRTTPRDVRVDEINDAWNEVYSSDRFWNFAPLLLKHTPPHFKENVAFLLSELDELAKVGRLKNLNEWIGNVVHSRDAPVMSFVAEAEYAVYVVRQNPRYQVTFEPEGGFYRGNPRDVAALGMRQKSIDLRISDMDSGEVVALREVKSSAGRGMPGENFQDAYNKVRLVHHLQVPELSEAKPVEIGLVYLYDYDPQHNSNPYRDHNLFTIRDRTVEYLEHLQKDHSLPEKPFDTITFIDFGSRRVLFIQRLADDSLQVSDFMLNGKSFISLMPKMTAPDAIELRQWLESHRR